MSEVFRIIDKFRITSRGIVYTVKISKGVVIHLGDILSDLKGNRFEVRGIEMFRGLIPEGKSFEEMPLGLMFKQLNGVEVSGNILVRDLNDINFIFCNHLLYQRKVDEDYEEEYQEAGLHHPCALFSYEDLEMGILSLFGETISGLTIYRGGMMKPDMYSVFYSLLEQRDIYLINTPEEYERYLTLPGWYDDFAEKTAPSMWESEGNIENALLKARQLDGPYIVKDYVKSRKYEWYDACFIKNISDIGNAACIIKNFLDRQGESLVGGIVLRKFMNLKQIGFHEKSGMPISEEYRVFVYAGKILIMDNYWTENENLGLSETEISWIEDIAQKVKSNFVTVDIARKDDGELMIIELGDGQVSGLQQIDVKEFYKSFENNEDMPIEELFPEGVIILSGDPMPDKTAEQMRLEIAEISNTQELVDAYVQVHNKFWYIEDDLYDYKNVSEEYNRFRKIVDVWEEIMDSLDERVMASAKEEGLLAERQPGSGTVKQLEGFMSKYGYRDGGGWWIKIEQ